MAYRLNNKNLINKYQLMRLYKAIDNKRFRFENGRFHQRLE